ncbi:hypothetical protein [Dickeya zeae]|uniref:hypothetical protein n=1 Tax=Dickeya zeae TaxID=204042 RepID=UPI0034D21CFD
MLHVVGLIICCEPDRCYRLLPGWLSLLPSFREDAWCGIPLGYLVTDGANY